MLLPLRRSPPPVYRQPSLCWGGAGTGPHSPISLTPSLAAPHAGVERSGARSPFPPQPHSFPCSTLCWGGTGRGLHSPISLTSSLAAPRAGVEQGEVPIPPHPHSFPCSAPCWGGTGRGPHSPSSSLLPLQRPVLGWNRERSPFPLILTPSLAAPRAGVEQGEVPIPHHPHSFPCSAPCWGGTGAGPWVAIPPSAPCAGVEQGQIPGSLFPLQRPVLGWSRGRSLGRYSPFSAPCWGGTGRGPHSPSSSLLPLQRPVLGWNWERSPFPPQPHSFPCSAPCWGGARPGPHSPLSLTPSPAVPSARVEQGQVPGSLFPLQRPVLG
ncbi:vegetative cell wall protein gp1-like isoform X4 [Gopherus evgoodei]|uniref:vegetative cell wall protein gp1-like isoform X4 n=1 Tax=Gopherus evgoodei TaxID=1825980 RepID=UPI0011CF0AA2|nr:vegetative cell wall protein gp1-like isoform X4 [Gopherus evgoodei]